VDRNMTSFRAARDGLFLIAVILGVTWLALR
jgi:hypothetical protein